MTEDPDRHTKLAKVVCKLLNDWHDGGKIKRKSSAPAATRQSESFDKKWLDDLLSRAADHDSLGVDNQAFVSDMTDRLEKWGDRLFISKPQMSYLKIIEDKIS